MYRLVLLTLALCLVALNWHQVPKSLRSQMEAIGKDIKALPPLAMKEWCPELGTDLTKALRVTRQELSDAIAPTHHSFNRYNEE